jgi:tetratricopeptide (TPR) repeat protein
MSLRSRIASLLLVLGLPLAPVAGQSLEERLDEERFLRGLVEMELRDALEHYLETHPAKDPVRAARHEIIRAHLAWREHHADPAVRLAAAERALEARRALLERFPDHPRHALWLADQAADLYFRVLPHEQAGLAALFGVPSAAQRDRALRVAREMVAAGALAEIEIDQAIMELEMRPGYRSNESLQMERRRLGREERDRRIPFLHGIGLTLHALLVPQSAAERQDRLEMAVELLGPLGGELTGALASQARLYEGLARGELGEREAAADLLRMVITDEHSAADDVFAARLGIVRNRTARRGVQAGLAELDAAEAATGGSLRERLLIADQRYLLRRELAEQERGTPAGDAALRDAYRAYVELLGSVDPSVREAMRRTVFERLVLVSGPEAPLDELPPIVSVARAEREAASDDSRPAAIARLERVLERPDATEGERAAALFALGKALHASGRLLDAARRFTELADRHPAAPEAERSIELAATIAARALDAAPDDADARAVLRASLDVLLERYPNLPSVDRWRYVAGRLALDAESWDEAVDWFGQVSPGAREWIDARFMEVNARREKARRTEDPRARAAAGEAVIAAADTALADLAGGADRAADRAWYVAYLRVFRAEALLEQGRAREAVETLEGMARRADLDSAARAAALRVRIDAYQALERPEEARADIVRFLEAAPEQAGYVIDSMLASMLAEVEGLLEESRDQEAGRLARDELEPLAAMLEGWLEDHAAAPEITDGLVRRVADVYRASGRLADALRLYDRIAARYPDAVELLLGRAECLYGLGGDGYGEAMRIYRRITSAGPEVGHDVYWQAQVRTLEILDAVQRNTDKIVPRINQLRLEDESLGGERYRRALQRLERKYGAS